MRRGRGGVGWGRARQGAQPRLPKAADAMLLLKLGTQLAKVARAGVPRTGHRRGEGASTPGHAACRPGYQRRC